MRATGSRVEFINDPVEVSSAHNSEAARQASAKPVNNFPGGCMGTLLRRPSASASQRLFTWKNRGEWKFSRLLPKPHWIVLLRFAFHPPNAIWRPRCGPDNDGYGCGITALA